MMEFNFNEDWSKFKKRPYAFPYHSKPWNDWGKPFELQKPVIEEFSILPPDRIPLGTDTDPNSPYYGEPCYMKFNKNRRITVIICGDNDSGKTTFLKSFVVDNLHGRFGLYLAWIDPKGDAKDLNYPNEDKRFTKILNDLTFKPRAYHTLETYPKFAGMVGAQGLEFTLSLADLKGISKSETFTNIANFTSLDQDDPSIPLLASAVFSDNPPEKFDDLMTFIANLKTEGMSTRAEKLQNRLNYLKQTDQLGDTPVNFPKLLRENGILVLRVPLKKERNVNVTDLIASTFISSFANDRELFARTGQGYMDRPPVIICDEANKYAGEKTATNELLTQVTTKYRSINNFVGMYSILCVQHVSDLDYQQVMEADYIIGTRLTYEKDIDLLKRRAGFNIHRMQTTEFRIGIHPKEFWIIDKNNGIRTFKPYPICSRMVQPKANAS